jgi:D-3-phosphoglycerate dehydrogenase / 2-oxoglutarate reductase
MTRDEIVGTILIAPHQFPHIDRERALAEEFGIELVESPDKAAFRAGIADAAVVMVTPYARVDAEDFLAMKTCRAVVRYGMGYDNIDVEAATVPVSIVPGTASEEVASHALAMGLALARRIPHGSAAIAADGWAGSVGYDAPKLTDLDVGVLGMGRIGRYVATWWAALGARVRAHDPFSEFDDIASASVDEILRGSDVISLHVPLNDDTRHLISAESLAIVRQGAVIVNVSRGGLIDEAALADALRSGRVAGAGLDVFAEEPLPADHVLRDAPNAILTPHVAWRSNQSLDALQEAAVDRARKALTGQPLPDVVSG